MHTHAYKHTDTLAHTHVHIHMHFLMRVRMHADVRGRLDLRAHIHIHIHIHVHNHILYTETWTRTLTYDTRAQAHDYTYTYTCAYTYTETCAISMPPALVDAMHFASAAKEMAGSCLHATKMSFPVRIAIDDGSVLLILLAGIYTTPLTYTPHCENGCLHAQHSIAHVVEDENLRHNAILQG